MAERDRNQKEVLFSDVSGDAEKVRAILAGWGVEESSIRRLMREHRVGGRGDREVPRPAGRGALPYEHGANRAS